MKFKYLLVLIAIIATGCGNQEPETTSANSDLMQVESPNKILSVADIDLTEPYYFAYQDQPVENYDTYNTINPISITVDSATTLSIYGSGEPLETVDVTEPYVTVELNAGETYVFESSFAYYEIDSSEPTTAVISVS